MRLEVYGRLLKPAGFPDYGGTSHSNGFDGNVSLGETLSCPIDLRYASAGSALALVVHVGEACMLLSGEAIDSYVY